MRSLAVKILDVFRYKYEPRLKDNDYRNFTKENKNYDQFHVKEGQREYDFTDNPGVTFESALPLIFEDVSTNLVIFFQTLVEYIKLLYVNLSTMNLQIPWIYIMENKELLSLRGNEYLARDVDANVTEKVKKWQKQADDDKARKKRAQDKVDLEATIKKEVHTELGVPQPDPAKDTTPIFALADYETVQEEKKQASPPPKKEESVSEKTFGTTKVSTKDKKRRHDEASSARRDGIPAEKSVDKYAKDKRIHELEVEFNYGTDEDSVYASHEYELYRMPPEVFHKFALGSDSAGA